MKSRLFAPKCRTRYEPEETRCTCDMEHGSDKQAQCAETKAFSFIRGKAFSECAAIRLPLWKTSWRRILLQRLLPRETLPMRRPNRF